MTYYMRDINRGSLIFLGRGILYGLISRILFIIGSYTIYIYAGRKLGAGLFGTFGIVISIVTISNIILNNGVRQTISKLIALYPNSAYKICKQSILGQLILSIPISVVVSGLAGGIAAFFKDNNLVIPLRICGIFILVRSLFYVFIGALNGQKRFLAENVVLSMYFIMRPAAAIFLIWLGFGIPGAIFGFLSAAILVTIVSIALFSNSPNEAFILTITDTLKPSIINIIIFGSSALLMSIDLLFIKRLMVGSHYAGLYTAATAFSKPPYWFLFPFGSIALPLVTLSFNGNDIQQCRKYLSQILRYSILIFLPIIIIIAATSQSLIVFFFSPEYGPAGMPLKILIFGIWFVGLTSIMAHFMIAMGKERLMAYMSLCCIGLDVIFNIFLVPKFGLMGAAISTSVSAFMLLFVSAYYIINEVGVEIKPLTFYRLTSLCALLYFVPQIPLFKRLSLPVSYIILYVGFALGLIVTREIGPSDWLVIKRLVYPRIDSYYHELSDDTYR
ncbi:MAG: polysaccharide biosynthesis C-terminal domain-containing protein [bacterium]